MAISRETNMQGGGLKVILWGAVMMLALSLSLSVAAYTLSNGPDVTTRTWTRAAIAKRAHASSRSTKR